METILCKYCAYGFDEVEGNGLIHCCRHKKTMNETDTCEDGKEY